MSAAVDRKEDLLSGSTSTILDCGLACVTSYHECLPTDDYDALQCSLSAELCLSAARHTSGLGRFVWIDTLLLTGRTAKPPFRPAYIL